MVTEAAPKSLVQKAVFDKGKACGDFPDAMGFKRFFSIRQPLDFVLLIVRWLPQWVCAWLLGTAAGGIRLSGLLRSLRCFFMQIAPMRSFLGANLQPFLWRVSPRLVLETTFFYFFCCPPGAKAQRRG